MMHFKRRGIHLYLKHRLYNLQNTQTTKPQLEHQFTAPIHIETFYYISLPQMSKKLINKTTNMPNNQGAGQRPNSKVSRRSRNKIQETAIPVHKVTVYHCLCPTCFTQKSFFQTRTVPLTFTLIMATKGITFFIYFFSSGKAFSSLAITLLSGS